MLGVMVVVLVVLLVIYIVLRIVIARLEKSVEKLDNQANTLGFLYEALSGLSAKVVKTDDRHFNAEKQTFLRLFNDISRVRQSMGEKANARHFKQLADEIESGDLDIRLIALTVHERNKGTSIEDIEQMLIDLI